MKKFLNWLLISSENPKETSLTVRGILMSFVPLLITFAEEIGIVGLDKEIIFFVVASTAILGITLACVGLIRKLINTFGEKKIVVFKASKTVDKSVAKKSKKK